MIVLHEATSSFAECHNMEKHIMAKSQVEAVTTAPATESDDLGVFRKNTTAVVESMADSAGKGKTVAVRFKNGTVLRRYVSAEKIVSLDIKVGATIDVALWERESKTLTFTAGHQATTDDLDNM
jgi:hypothetical protein